MKFSKLLILAMLATTFTAVADDDIVVADSTGFKFTDVKIAKTTSVKDQNKSGTCWSFSGISFIEDEILRKTGVETDLSEMFIARKCYEDKARKFVRLYGAANFAQGGSLVDVVYVLKNYGIIPNEVYAGLEYGEDKHVHSEIEKVLTAYLKQIVTVPNKKLSTAWFRGYNGILDAYFGEIPEKFKYKGKTYTPKQYAESLGLNFDDYVAITSYTHHPFYESFPLEVADNWLWAQYYNIPLAEMQAVVDNAIENGYTVAWAADVSEGGFQWRKGYAIMPKEKLEADMDGTELSRWVHLSDNARERERFEVKGPVPEIEVTQELRQQMFDNQETTDDHGMVIVGSAVDQNGNKYYKVKNSWDTNQVYDGFFYVSVPYFLSKTLSIMVNKEVIPTATKNKLGL